MDARKLNRLKKLQDATITSQKAYAAYKAKLAEECDHPEAFRDKYTYSSSNGYGSWRTEIMPWCMICNQVQRNSAYSYRWGKIPVNRYDD